MEDEKIIELFFARSEQAIAELDGKYGKMLRALSFRILNDRQDAEECVNDAYLGTWNAIPPNRPQALVGFVCKIVRNLSLKRYEQNTAAKRNGHYDAVLEELEDCLAAPDTVEAQIASRELTELIEGFLSGLSSENRVIFLRRYWFADSYAQIAARVALTEKNVSVRLTRLRKQLREYLMKKGVFV